jgi:hypothetical protein
MAENIHALSAGFTALADGAERCDAMPIITNLPYDARSQAGQSAIAASGSALNDRVQFALDNSLLPPRAAKAVQKLDGAGCRRNAEGVRDQQEDHGRLEEVDHLLAKHDCLQSAGSPIACFDGHTFDDLIGAIYCAWVVRDTDVVALPEP